MGPFIREHVKNILQTAGAMCCIGKSTGFVVVAIIEARNWYLFYVDFYLSFAQCHGVIVIRVMMSFTCPHTCLKGYGPPSASAVDIILLHLQTKIHHSPAPPYPLSLSLSLLAHSLRTQKTPFPPPFLFPQSLLLWMNGIASWFPTAAAAAGVLKNLSGKAWMHTNHVSFIFMGRS